MADTQKTIRIVVDSSGVKRGVAQIKRQFDSLNKTVSDRFGNMANRTLFTLGASLSVLGKRFSALRRVITLVGAAFRKAWGGIRFIVENTITVINKAKSAFGGFKALLQGAITSTFIREIVRSSVIVQKFASTLTVVTGNFDAAKVKINDLVKIVQKFGVSFEAALGPFAKFFAAAKGTLTENEILNIFTAFTEVSAALQLNVQEVQGVFLALQQIASKGRVSMEELRLQLAERVPGAMQIAASSMGLTIRELEDAIRRGTLSSGEFLKKFGQALHENFGEAAATASQLAFASMNRFRTSLLLFLNEIGEGGFLDAFQRLLTVISSWFDENTVFANRLGELMGTLLNQMTNVIENLTDEKLSSVLNGILNWFYRVFEAAEAIGNSKFMRWLLEGTEAGQIRQAEDEVKRLQTELIRLGEKWAELFAKPYGQGAKETGFANLLATMTRRKAEYEAVIRKLEALTGDRFQVDFAAPPSGTPEDDAAAHQRQIDILGKTYANVSKEVDYYNSRLVSSSTDVSELTFLTNELIQKQNLLAEANRKFKDVDLTNPESIQDAIAAGQKVSGIVADLEKMGKRKISLENKIKAATISKQKFITDFQRAYLATEDKIIDKVKLRMDLEDNILLTRIEIDSLNKAISEGTFTKEEKARAQSLLASLKAYRSELKSLNAEQRQYRDFLNDFNIKTEIMQEGELNWYEKLIRAQTRIKDIKKELISLNEKAQTSTLNQDEIERVKELQNALKANMDVFNDMSIFAKRAAENVQDIFADFLFDPFKDGLDGMLSQFGDMLRRMIAEAAAAQIAEAIFGKNGANLTSIFTTIGGFFGAGGGGGGGGGTGHGVASLFGRAHGGPVIAGVPFIGADRNTADKGEIFIPNQSGTVLSRSQEENLRNNQGGGSPIIVNVTVASDVTRSSGVQVGNDIARQIGRSRRLS